MLEQVEVLIDYGYMIQPVFVPVNFGGGAPIQIDGSGGRHIQSGQQGQKGGFTAAGAANNGVNPALFKGSADTVHSLDGLMGIAVFVNNFLCG